MFNLDNVAVQITYKRGFSYRLRIPGYDIYIKDENFSLRSSYEIKRGTEYFKLSTAKLGIVDELLRGNLSVLNDMQPSTCTDFERCACLVRESGIGRMHWSYASEPLSCVYSTHGIQWVYHTAYGKPEKRHNLNDDTYPDGTYRYVYSGNEENQELKVGPHLLDLSKMNEDDERFNNTLLGIDNDVLLKMIAFQQYCNSEFIHYQNEP